MELPSLARKAGCPTAEMHVCQLMLQAQAKLWEGLSCMAEHLDNLNAVIRELVVRRYKPADIKRIEAGEYGDVDDIPADEDPEFQLQYQKNRYACTHSSKLHAVTQEGIEHQENSTGEFATKEMCQWCIPWKVHALLHISEMPKHGCICREAALAAVMEFLTGEGVAGAARLLYEVEVLLLGPPFQEDSAPAKGGKGVAVDVADAEQSLSCKAQLLAVLGESILDESMPAAAVPFLSDLFAQSAHRLLPKNPTLKVQRSRWMILNCTSNLDAYHGLALRPRPLALLAACADELLKKNRRELLSPKQTQQPTMCVTGGAGGPLDGGLCQPRPGGIEGGRCGGPAVSRPGVAAAAGRGAPGRVQRLPQLCAGGLPRATTIRRWPPAGLLRPGGVLCCASTPRHPRQHI